MTIYDQLTTTSRPKIIQPTIGNILTNLICGCYKQFSHSACGQWGKRIQPSSTLIMAYHNEEICAKLTEFPIFFSHVYSFLENIYAIVNRNGKVDVMRSLQFPIP
jgi:hypothetical protein